MLLYSLVETPKENWRRPSEYLAGLLRGLPNLDTQIEAVINALLLSNARAGIRHEISSVHRLMLTLKRSPGFSQEWHSFAEFR